ncbi:unnamed protein product [Parnassius apollo]|uniref:(apollo) hypothetical protein n=1 Tax=Parnassius apollo TaxID=110799 RepID=A0A8S3Y2A4_PARAO|nr:unnamed protein product [Parnassius apollo]
MRHDDAAVPIFDLDKSNDGAAAWCESFDKLGDELKWSSFEKVAKAGKALRGSALSWFDTWEPETGVEDADHPELNLIANTKDLWIASGQSPTTPESMLEPELIPEPEPTLKPESRPETRAEKPLEPLALEATSTEQNTNGASSEPELDPELLEALGVSRW